MLTKPILQSDYHLISCHHTGLFKDTEIHQVLSESNMYSHDSSLIFMGCVRWQRFTLKQNTKQHFAAIYLLILVMVIVKVVSDSYLDCW